jgi:putative transferase (TIGR04331 family)
MALMVEMAIPRYSYHMYAVPVAGQWLSYFEDQCRFISALPESLRQQVLVRLNMNDFGWCQKDRWMKHFPNIKLETGQKPLHNLIKKSRLYISTYNATTFLESLSWNMPTIMFWNPNHWELKDDAVPYFDILKSVNILHETPEVAAKHMEAVWGDIPAWWESDELQKTRKYFCERYSHTPEKPIDKLEMIFRNIAI